MAINHYGFFQFINPKVSSTSGGGRMHIACRAKDNYKPVPRGFDKTKPFTLIRPWMTKTPMCEKTSMSKLSTTYETLGPGMILMRNYISLKDQVDIVNICENLGGFYVPSNENGEKLRLNMTCFGRNWDPITRYAKRFRNDASEPPAIPSELISLAEATITDAQAHLNELPSMHPDICLANFYSPTYGHLGIHQDCDESCDSLQKGLPIVSISIGDAALFLYGHTSDVIKLESVYLRSGDVLIFGGKSRLIYHGVDFVFPGTSPMPLKYETGLRPGRLNLTFRQL